jgi:hypothetical protein
MAGRLGVEVKDVAKDGKVLYICFVENGVKHHNPSDVFLST